MKSFFRQKTDLGARSSSIQSDLIDYFQAKVNNDMTNDNISKDDIDQTMRRFESVIITPEIIEERQKNPNQYIGLSESIEKYHSFKSSYNVKHAPASIKTTEKSTEISQIESPSELRMAHEEYSVDLGNTFQSTNAFQTGDTVEHSSDLNEMTQSTSTPQVVDSIGHTNSNEALSSQQQQDLSQMVNYNDNGPTTSLDAGLTL